MSKVLDKSIEKKIFHTVVKRNGKLVPFHQDRIFNAIESAFRDTKKIAKQTPLNADLKKVIQSLTKQVVDQLNNMALKGTQLTVEGIQDVVEISLMKNGYHDIARDYIIYRDHRKEIRQETSGELKIFRHDQATSVRFNPMKIAESIERAFRRFYKIEKIEHPSEHIIQSVNLLASKVVEKATSYAKDTPLTFSVIQDLIENQLMEEKFFDIAKAYILHRSEKEKLYSSHEKYKSNTPTSKEQSFKVITKDGIEKVITESQIKHKLQFACKGFEKQTSFEDLFNSSVLNFYQGMKESEIDTSNIMAARSKIEKEPTYSYVAARLLLDTIYRETLHISSSDRSLQKIHQQYFKIRSLIF